MSLLEVFYKKDQWDVVAKALKHDIKTAGYLDEFVMRTANLYKFEGDLTNSELEKISQDFLADPIIQSYKINSVDSDFRYENFYIIDIWLKNGVTDTVGQTVQRGIKTLNINKDVVVKTGHRYLISNELSRDKVETIVSTLLTNSIIQEYSIRTI
ncbi:phosphoribosylformylglycinamidine synthase subunit PurS [bacterium]